MPEEDLRRSLLQPEEVGLQQQKAELDGPELLGKTSLLQVGIT